MMRWAQAITGRLYVADTNDVMIMILRPQIMRQEHKLDMPLCCWLHVMVGYGVKQLGWGLVGKAKISPIDGEVELEPRFFVLRGRFIRQCSTLISALIRGQHTPSVVPVGWSNVVWNPEFPSFCRERYPFSWTNGVFALTLLQFASDQNGRPVISVPVLNKQTQGIISPNGLLLYSL